MFLMSLTILEIALLFFMLLTLLVLGTGIFFMVMGGRLNEKYSQSLMRWRVILQGITLTLLALVLLKKGT